MGKNRRRGGNTKRGGGKEALSSTGSSIELKKEEVEKKSKLGFVFYFDNGQEGGVCWYSVDSMFENSPATQFDPPDSFNTEGFSCATVGSKLIVLGASLVIKGRERSKHVFLLDKDGGGRLRWTRLPDMISGRYFPRVVVSPLNNKVYVFGSHIFNSTSHISNYGEYLDMSLPRKQWKWKPLPEPPFRKRLKFRFHTFIAAAFFLNIGRSQELALGLSTTAETYSLNLDTHIWTDRSTRYPRLDWLEGRSPVIVLDDILLVWRGDTHINVYDLKTCSYLPDPVSGLEYNPSCLYFLFQSTNKRDDLYLVVCGAIPKYEHHPTRCIRFRVEICDDPQGIQGIRKAKAVVKSNTQPFDITGFPMILLPIGEEGEEEKGTA